MKHLLSLRLLLLCNGLIEVYFGLSLLISPENICQSLGCEHIAHPSFSLIAQMYGAAATSLGALSFLSLQALASHKVIKRPYIHGMIHLFIIFAFFHISMATIQIINNPNRWASLLHIILGAGFSYFLLRTQYRLGNEAQ